MLKQPYEPFFKKMLWEISQNSQENICAGISFLVFSCEFCEICRNTFFGEQHRRLLLIIVGSTVVKGVLANETVNYDTKALRKKCPNSKSSYYGVNLRIQSEYGKIRTTKNSAFPHFSCSGTKTCSVLKNFVNSTGKHLCWSLFLIKLQA